MNHGLESAQPAAPLTSFVPSRGEALNRLKDFVVRAGSDYRANRNHDGGAGQHVYVSQLSPYIRNGLISEEEVVATILKSHTFAEAEKFLQEVFWRVYWKGYLENRPVLWTRYREDLEILKNKAADYQDYPRADSASTGIKCFDTWSQELQETGYLHNHTRMWFASIWIFTLKLPWQLGADFFLRHLLDGDPASNTLSWRWVAGLHTKGKNYLARSSNIAKFTANRFPDVNGLATQADAIEESHPDSPITSTELPLPPPFLSNGQGLLILDEDLREHIPSLDPTTPVLGLYPELSYEVENTSPTVSTYKKACLAEALASLESKHGCNTEFTPQPTARNILEWAKRNNLQTLFLAQPQVGPWRDLWHSIAASLKAEGVALSYFRPWWEKELFPSATHGFFKFRKGIQSVAQRMSAEDSSNRHASS
ncbi:hypothetical protein VDG1235_809 [Verrucomicrobiia bacterium DG1235]|nr:hypothetical protein VDG1235_809 [Verrucomicrobiae bacterium DG1235]